MGSNDNPFPGVINTLNLIHRPERAIRQLADQ